MITGAVILLAGIAIGYILRPIMIKEDKMVQQTIKKVFTNQKGIIVDLTPPAEIGEPLNDIEDKTVS